MEASPGRARPKRTPEAKPEPDPAACGYVVSAYALASREGRAMFDR